MRRGTVLAVSLLAVAGGLAPAEAKPPPRTFAADYTGTAIAGAQKQYVGARCGPDCVTFTVARAGERRVRISITDTSGRAVGWVASIGSTTTASGCGTGVVAAKPGQEWWIQAAVLDSCTAVPSQGRVVATLSP